MYLLSEYEISNNGDGSTTVISLCATPTFIAAGLENGWIHVENVDGGRSTALDSHQGPVWALAATSGPEILVSGASDGLVKIWNIASGLCLYSLSGHTSTVRFLETMDASTVVSASRDSTMRVWNVDSGICLHVLSGHIAPIRCLTVRGNLAVSGSLDGTAKVWKPACGECVHTMQGHNAKIFAVQIIRDGNQLATGDENGNVIVWDIHTGSMLATLPTATSDITPETSRDPTFNNTAITALKAVDFHTLVSSGADGTVRVWSLDSHVQQRCFTQHPGAGAFALEILNGQVIFAAGSDDRFGAWDYRSEEVGVRTRLDVQTDGIWVAVKTQQGITIAFRRNQKTVVQIWNLKASVAEA